MFGPNESLDSPTEHPEWGLLPRIVDATLKHMALHPEKSMSLTISAVELYSYGAWDINAKKRHACTITTGVPHAAHLPALGAEWRGVYERRV